MTALSFTRDDLLNMKPEHATFVGIDSDGCVFDTMEIKQKKCFHSLIISQWSLEKIEKEVRQTAEFVNLYSKWRGTNRFIALAKMFDMLEERPEPARAGVRLPDMSDLKNFIASGAPLGNRSIGDAVRRTGSACLGSVLKWSEDVNALIEKTVVNVPPFPFARESLDRIRRSSDAICVSQTPEEALVREWSEHGLLNHVRIVAGQELGSKTEHISLATRGRYQASQILMIGDAPGDLKAAKDNKALFYPINPGHEAESWKRFLDEEYDLFLSGKYPGAREEQRIAEFQALLPETPPWRVG